MTRSLEFLQEHTCKLATFSAALAGLYRGLGAAHDRLRAAIVLGCTEPNVVQRLLERVRVLVLLGHGLTASVLVVPPGFKVFKKVSEMTSPNPSGVFLLLNEREDSINDGSYLMLMDGFNPSGPGSRTITDYPANYHNGAGGLNFCDGHAEVHRWLDARTTPN